MVGTLNDAREAAASITQRGFIFLDDALSPTDWSFAEICHEAKRIGGCLQAQGLAKGDRLALVLASPENFVLSFLGAVSAGVMPVPMYPPLALGRLDNYIDRIEGILRVSGAKILLTTKELFPVLHPVLSHVPTVEKLLDINTLRFHSADSPLNPVEIHPDEPCLLQFTSGSTAEPRGVIVTHRNLIANANAIIDSLQIHPELDRAMSWLPLYHDMGLIGFVITTLIAQASTVLIPTIVFVKHPGIWMETAHKYRATITFGPNFAFDLAAKRASKKISNLDLSCLRVLGCGAEPINPKTLDNFLTAFTPYSLRANALLPCYGMAEATLAITFEKLNRPVRKLVIDRHTYESSNIARPIGSNNGQSDPRNRIELVSCGRTYSNHEMRIVDEKGDTLPEGCVGEIVFRGPSITPGYYLNPTATRKLLRGGWLHTGDLGFILNGDLFISGRQKDLVIINGRNYSPQSIEWVVEEVAGVRKGCVVAFSVDGNATEKLIVVAETTATEQDVLTQAVSERIRSTLGLIVDKVVFVGKGSIPKTSSGKLQRRKTKTLFEGGLLGTSGDLQEISPSAEGLVINS